MSQCGSGSSFGENQLTFPKVYVLMVTCSCLQNWGSMFFNEICWQQVLISCSRATISSGFSISTASVKKSCMSLSPERFLLNLHFSLTACWCKCVWSCLLTIFFSFFQASVSGEDFYFFSLVHMFNSSSTFVPDLQRLSVIWNRFLHSSLLVCFHVLALCFCECHQFCLMLITRTIFCRPYCSLLMRNVYFHR